MIAHLMIAGALLLQQSPEERDRAEQILTGYSRIERFAEATVRIEECSQWGYEAGTGVMSEVVDTWERYLRPNGVTIEGLMERYNARVERLRTEAIEEQDHATTNRQAFTIFRRNFGQRCAALAYDRPDWLEGRPLSFSIATMGWDDVANELFGPEATNED